jgi:hypothetical protein
VADRKRERVPRPRDNEPRRLDGPAGKPGWVASAPTPDYLAALRAGIEKAIETAGPDYGKALKELEEAVQRVPPFDLICFSSLYFLCVPAGTNPEFNRPEGIFQHHVELIQAVALRQPLADAKPEVPNQNGVGDVTAASTAVTDAFMILETARLAQAKGDAERRRKMALSSLRLYAAFVRGDAYHTVFKQGLLDLFGPLDDDLSDLRGVSAGALVRWWWAVSEVVDQRLQEHLASVQTAMALPVDDQWPDRIREVFPRLPAEPDGELMKQLASDAEQRRAFGMIAGDLNLYRVFGFTFDELRSLYPGDVDPDRLRAVLDAWSLTYGDTAGISLDRLLLENPVTSRPIVRLNDRLFLWSIPPAFHNSAFEMIERLIEDDEEFERNYLERRGAYLEQAVADALVAKFPGAKVMRNVYWTSPEDGKRYETDVLVLVDSTVLIAECKGGRLSAHSRKGKARPTREDIDDLLVRPGVQAMRLAALLERGHGEVALDTKDGETIVVDTSKVHQVVTVGTTLEPLAAMLPALREVVESGLTDEELEALSYNITVFDLKVILEILEHPSEVIHYFLRRGELEKGEFLSGEEADLLGFYLQTGFNLGEAEFSREHRMQASGLSDPIDVYYYSREAGLEPEKPRVQRTEWWEALLSSVERRALPRWTEIGRSLCNVAHEEQQEFEDAMHELRRSIANGERQPDDFVLFANGPEQRRDYFIGLIVPDNSAERAVMMSNTAKQAFGENDTIMRVFVIGWSPDPRPGPYATFAVVERS